MSLRKQFWFCIAGTFVFTAIYSLSNAQFYAAFKAFLQNPGTLPAFFASDYFSGLEYGYIGNHLANGRGFIGPFEHVTGPTGTMPPVLPFIYAAIFSVCGFKTVASFWAIFFLRIFCVGVGFFLLIRLSIPLANRRIWQAAAVYAAIFATGNLFFFYYDEWFMWLMVCVSLTFALRILSSKQVSLIGALAFGLWIGILILTQTVMGAALLGATLVTALRYRRAVLAWTLPVALLVASVWVLRNYSVFGSAMPVKSNLGFELYFSTVHEPRGILILEEQNQSRKHPIKPGPEREYALSLGEHEYQRLKTEEFYAILRNEPSRYLIRVGYRLLYATVLFPLSKEEQKVHSPAPPFIKYVLYPIVFIFWLIQWFLPGRKKPFVFFCLMLYAGYLAPYILINFWLKYWVHMLPLYAAIVALSAAEFYKLYVQERE